MKMLSNFLSDAVMLSETEAKKSQSCSVEVYVIYDVRFRYFTISLFHNDLVRIKDFGMIHCDKIITSSHQP